MRRMNRSTLTRLLFVTYVLGAQQCGGPKKFGVFQPHALSRTPCKPNMHIPSSLVLVSLLPLALAGEDNVGVLSALKKKVQARRDLQATPSPTTATFDNTFRQNCLPKQGMNKLECMQLQSRYLSQKCQNDPSFVWYQADMKVSDGTDDNTRTAQEMSDQALFPTWRGTGSSCPSACAQYAAQHHKDLKFACGTGTPSAQPTLYIDPGGCQMNMFCNYQCQDSCHKAGHCAWRAVDNGLISNDNDLNLHPRTSATDFTANFNIDTASHYFNSEQCHTIID